MDIRELSYVNMIYKCGNITDAARDLFISPTALYKSLHKIEDELDKKLFYKDEGRMIPTEIGVIVIEAATEILNVISTMNEKIIDTECLKYGKVSVGVPSIVALMFFPNLLIEFQKVYPNIRIITAEDGGENLISRTTKNELDMAITMAPVGSDVLNEILITDDIVAAAVSPDHPWASKKYVTPSDFDGVPFITFDHTFRMHHQLMQRFQEARVKPDFAYTSLDCHFLYEMTKKTDGILVLPRPIIDFYSHGNLVTIPFNPPFPWRLALIYRRDIYMSKASRAFVAFIHNYFQNEINLS